MKRALLAALAITFAAGTVLCFSYTLGSMLAWMGTSLSESTGSETSWSVGPFGGRTSGSAGVVTAAFFLTTIIGAAGTALLLRRAMWPRRPKHQR